MAEIFVEKFGGASVNSAEAVKNVAHILGLENKKRLVVISAMGKTTNALENIVKTFFKERILDNSAIDSLIEYHTNIIYQLFNDENKELEELIVSIIRNIDIKILEYESYNQLYDSIVSLGELISTSIVSEYLNFIGIENKFIFATDYIKTDSNYTNANIDWIETQANIDVLNNELEDNNLFITQGFIASSKEYKTTTLGREGSDFSAAIFAYCLNAKTMTIWKDVSGLLNADPKYFQKTIKLDKVPFREAIELSYYGASIIHPKTIKPLENKSIPLYVKSFINPKDDGSIICHCSDIEPKIPSYIFKDNQVLLSMSPKDFSFIAEDNISSIFSILAKSTIKANLTQNSAISFSVCFDAICPETINYLMRVLGSTYNVKYNQGLRLITIRHYNERAIEEIIQHSEILIEQRSRVTAQFLVKNK